MNFALFLEMHARGRPNALALVDRRMRMSYGELNEAASRFAGVIRDAGLGERDRVALYLPNRVEMAIALLGAFKAGVIAVPLNWRLQPADLVPLLAHSRPGLLVTTEERGAAVLGDQVKSGLVVGEGKRAGSFWSALDAASAASAAVGRQSDDIANLLYTSGTTALPKAAIHTHGMRLAIAATMADCFQLSCRDVGLAVSPMFHTGGLSVFCNAIFAGGAAVLMERWNLDDFVRMIGQESVTFMHLVTTVVVDIVRAPETLFDELDTKVRFTWGGGHAVDPSLFVEFEKRVGGLFLQGYSRTEGGITYNPLDRARRRFDRHGLPNRNNSAIAIIDTDSGRACSPGETGEIAFHGDGVTPGYWNDEAVVAPRLHGELWQATGDMGYLTEEGELVFLGRRDHMIKTGGENVSPAEVGAVLLALPEVSDAVVFDMPDERLGQRVAALVVPKGEGLSIETIDAACRSSLAGFKIPRQIALVDALPRLGSQKVDLVACRDVLRRQAEVAG